VEFQSAKSLAQDMYIDDLEKSLSDAAKIMMDRSDGGRLPKNFAMWLDSTSARTSYSRLHQLHVEVERSFTEMVQARSKFLWQHADSFIHSHRGIANAACPYIVSSGLYQSAVIHSFICHVP
jgi:hypothetical protein